jgi:hypothetical protein
MPDLIKLGVIHSLILLFKFFSVVFNRFLVHIWQLSRVQNTHETYSLWIIQFSMCALHQLLSNLGNLLVWLKGGGCSFNLVFDFDFVIRGWVLNVKRLSDISFIFVVAFIILSLLSDYGTIIKKRMLQTFARFANRRFYRLRTKSEILPRILSLFLEKSQHK